MRDERRLRIWIDLANSPHVVFFAPLMAEFARRGHRTLLTARDFAQTLPMAEQAGMSVDVIGRHGGANLARKSLSVLDRAGELAAWARTRRIDLAVHHNSYGQAVAAAVLRIPSVTMMDYEHQPANHLSFRLSSKVMVPAVIPDAALRRFGAGRRLVRYDGLKEDAYVHGWSASGDAVREELGIASDRVVIAFRPEPDMAAYHRFGNPLCDELLSFLDSAPCTTLVLPRTAEQAERLARREDRSLRVLRRPLTAPELLAASDGVISAGGTMAREAAVAGVPAYSLFAGRPAAVDRYLADVGRLVPIASAEDFARIRIQRRRERSHAVPDGGRDLVERLADEILATARPSR